MPWKLPVVGTDRCGEPMSNAIAAGSQQTDVKRQIREHSVQCTHYDCHPSKCSRVNTQTHTHSKYTVITVTALI